MKCAHAWGENFCDGDSNSLLCYVKAFELVPRLEFSCKRFINHYTSNEEIIVLVDWSLPIVISLAKWLRTKRSQFKNELYYRISPVPEKENIIATTMELYDKLIAKQSQ